MDQLAQRLQQERVRRGLSISELAQRTKIREPYIHALESATYNVLPAVYVRSFIRTIGNELGIPSIEVNRLVAQCLDGSDAHPAPKQRVAAEGGQSPKSAERTTTSDPLGRLAVELKSTIASNMASFDSRSFFRKRRVATIIIAFVIIGGFVFWLTRGSSDTGLVDIPPEIIDVTSGEPDSLILTAVSTDTAELTITMDGERSSKYVVFPGTDYRWSAMKRFTVSNIFNAGSIQFARDGKPLPIYGKPGEVLRELVISRTEVVASNSSKKMITAPADPERARRDSIIEQKRRDSVRAERQKERKRRGEEVRKNQAGTKKSPAKPSRAQRKQNTEPKITKTPPRSVR